jgi:hypothetical protein
VWDTIRRELTFSLVQLLGYEVFVFNGKTLDPYQQQPALNFFFLPAR